MISQLLSPSRTKTAQDTGLHSSPYSVSATVSATRVYHAAFGSKENEWVYSGLKGSLVFGRNCDAQGYWFRLLEDAPGAKTIWMFNIPETNFEYRIDKPFFHCFQGRSRKFGFLFDDDGEAATFAEVISRATAAPARVPTVAATGKSWTTKATDLPRSIRSRFAGLSPASI